MRFTYQAYKEMLLLLRDNGYCFTDYHSYKEENPDKKLCILRHDIDDSIEKAYRMAEIEREMGIYSTWFVLVTGDIYNPMSRRNVDMLRKMVRWGGRIGLHFDEEAYPGLASEEKREKAELEASILGQIIGVPLRSVSMHRPSQKTLEENWAFRDLVNSYSEEFFHGFKYVSDSRRRWREPVEEIIASGEHPRLHILTHAFWYNETEKSLHDTVCEFVNSGNRERYRWEQDNTTDFEAVMGQEEVK